MKKILLATLCVAAFSLMGTNAQAQQRQGQVTGSFGISNSFGMSLIKKGINIALDSLEIKPITMTPVFVAQGDVGLTDWFSLGASYTHNRFSWSNRYTLDIDEIWPDKWGYQLPDADIEPDARLDFWLVRENIGVQALFHTYKNKAIDFYGGARVGLSFWRVGFRVAGGPESYSKVYQLPFTILTGTLIVGLRGYFNDYIGMHGELAVGTGPYLGRVGVQFRIGKLYD